MKHERRASSVSEPGRESGCVYVRACEREKERERERDEQRRGWLRERRRGREGVEAGGIGRWLHRKGRQENYSRHARRKKRIYE